MQKDMKDSPKTIKIDNVEYVPKDSYTPAEQLDGMDYVIIRGEDSGVFAGYLKSRNGREVILLDARRIWYWDGASSLSQLAMEGTSKPENCKFPCEVSKVQILDAIEVLDCTEKSRESIKSVSVWAQ
jgi:hypothetical protein